MRVVVALVALVGGCAVPGVPMPRGSSTVTLIRQSGQARLSGFRAILTDHIADSHTFHAALAVALASIGRPLQYEELMGLSGAAFRTQFHVSRWDAAAADPLVGEDCGVSVLATIGMEGQLHTVVREQAESADALVRDVAASIDQGIAPLADGLGVSPRWCVLVGHRTRRFTWWCRAPGDNPDVEDRVARTWPRAVLLISPPHPVNDLRPALVASLRRAVTLFDSGPIGEFAQGQAAFEAWMVALAESTGSQPPDGTGERDPSAASQPAFDAWGVPEQTAHQQLFAGLLSARRAAVTYLRRIAVLMPDVAARLLRAADYYDREVTVLLKHSNDLTRLQAAALLREAQALERKAIDVLRRF